MLPKMPLIASELLIEHQIQVFLLTWHGPGGVRGFRQCFHKIIMAPTCSQIVRYVTAPQFDGVYVMAVALDDHACIGYNITKSVPTVLSAHRVCVL